MNAPFEPRPPVLTAVAVDNDPALDGTGFVAAPWLRGPLGVPPAVGTAPLDEADQGWSETPMASPCL